MNTVSEKSLPLAIGLNFLLPGLGYMYMGKWLVGIFACLLIGTIYMTAPLILVIGLWFTINVMMMIDMLILSSKNKKQFVAQSTKKCPSCAELIQREAMVCRFCGAKFDVASGASPAMSTEAVTQSPQLPQSVSPRAATKKTPIVIGVTVVGVLVVLALVGKYASQKKDSAPTTQSVSQAQMPIQTPSPVAPALKEQPSKQTAPVNLSDTTSLKTRYGIITIAPDEPNAILGRKLLINGVQVNNGMPVESDHMAFVKHIQMPEDIEVIILNETCGGSLCSDIGLYRVYMLGPKGIAITNPFGTDKDQPVITVEGARITLQFGNTAVATFENGKMSIPAVLK